MTSKITLADDGPLLVAAPPPIKDHDGAVIATGAMAALCRCGASKTKPFCDGSHTAVGFSSAPDHSAIRNTEALYTGDVDGVSVTIAYTPVLCSHAGACQRLAPAVFQPGHDPWVDTAAGSLPSILNAMAACPSGALRVAIDDGAPQHLTTGDADITVEAHGPYHVRNVPLEAEFNGVGASRAKYVLCRCGLSKNKPFCDGSHHDAGWRDDDDAASRTPDGG